MSERNKDRDYKKISESCKKKWEDPDYRKKVLEATNTQEYKEKLSIAAQKNYSEGCGKWVKTKNASSVISNNTKNLWKNKDYREKQLIHFSSRTKKQLKLCL